MDLVVSEKRSLRNKIHPKKFALWVGCASITMMFAAFTSAYIVRQGAGNWLEFQLPSMFFVSAAVILLSSLSLHGAYYFFGKGNKRAYRGLLLGTFLLGLLFIVSQYLGWQEMVEIGVPLTTNPSGDFIYAISGVHAAHVLGGMAAIIVAIIHAFGLPFRVTATRKLRLEMTLTYWHFVDLLWIYLLVFFLLQQ
jgi:cytochrome c oxidase subunit 3